MSIHPDHAREIHRLNARLVRSSDALSLAWLSRAEFGGRGDIGVRPEIGA
jgi:hypothetical protein